MKIKTLPSGKVLYVILKKVVFIRLKCLRTLKHGVCGGDTVCQILKYKAPSCKGTRSIQLEYFYVDPVNNGDLSNITSIVLTLTGCH